MLPRCLASLLAACALCACAPTVHLPDLAAGGLPAVSDSAASLARLLAPVLHVQHDEPFPLVRVAAVIHPTKPLVAYHLLWSHDVNGQWLPWAKPSDEEEVWVGYDPATHAATDIWTYWHGTVLHTKAPDPNQVNIDVQWGKHGSLPSRVVESDLPRGKTLNDFYAMEFILLPDILMGKLAHGGPWGFFHGYGRYRDYDRPIDVRTRLDAVIVAEDPTSELRSVFGRKFSNKLHWPWQLQ
jgi:hypothetical protein